MKPVAFDYHAPATVEGAIALLTRYGGEAKLTIDSGVSGTEVSVSIPATAVKPVEALW